MTLFGEVRLVEIVASPADKAILVDLKDGDEWASYFSY